MRQTAIVLSLFGSFIIYALTIHLFETAIMFLLFGFLPGHVEPVPARHMLTIYSGAAVAVIGYTLRNNATNLLTMIASYIFKRYKRLSLHRAQA